MNKAVLFWIGIFIGVCAFSQGEFKFTQLAPGQDEFSGWDIKDSLKVIENDEFYKYNTTNADLYFEYGIKNALSVKYVDSTAATILLEIFDMVDNEAAFGIYTLESSTKGVHLDMGDEGILYDYYLHYRKGNYYIRCTTSRKTLELIEMIKEFGAYPANKINIKGKVPQITLGLDFEAKEIKHLKYFKGQIGLGNIIDFGHGSVAGFKEGVSGKWEDKMFFIFGYENERKRREWFASCKGKMQLYDKFTDYESVEDGFIVRDNTGREYAFRPFGRYYIVFKGMDWSTSSETFTEIISKLE